MAVEFGALEEDVFTHYCFVEDGSVEQEEGCAVGAACCRSLEYFMEKGRSPLNQLGDTSALVYLSCQQMDICRFDTEEDRSRVFSPANLA